MDDKDKKDAQLQFAQPELSSFALQDQKRYLTFFIHIYAILYKKLNTFFLYF